MYTQNNTNYIVGQANMQWPYCLSTPPTLMYNNPDLGGYWPMMCYYPPAVLPGMHQFKHFSPNQLPTFTSSQLTENEVKFKKEQKGSSIIISNRLEDSILSKQKGVQEEPQNCFEEYVNVKENCSVKKKQIKIQSKKLKQSLFQEKSTFGKIKQFVVDCLKKQRQYNTIPELIRSQGNLVIQVLQEFDNRVKAFRKSKEEMLKIIIRRIQRYHRSTRFGRRGKKFILYGGFKSMNIAYLSKLFSDAQFVQSYKAVSGDFNSQFEIENEKKINEFVQKVSLMKSKQEANEALISLDKKGQMPWPEFWMQKMGRVLVELYWRYAVKQIKF